MTNLTIQIDSQPIQQKLTELAQHTQNMQPAFNAIGQEIRELIDLCFRDLRSPDSVNWAVLSPVTIAKRRNNSNIPLTDTGTLRNSFTVIASNDFVEVGTNSPQAALMNFGGTKAQFPHLWGDIPARPFMPTSNLHEIWEQAAVKAVENYIAEWL